MRKRGLNRYSPWPELRTKPRWRYWYLTCRWWTDRELARQYRGGWPSFLTLFGIAGAALLIQYDQVWGSVAMVVAVTWTLFVLWRAARLFKLLGYYGDQEYDSRTKRLLSKEYRKSNSATLSARRRRIAKRRQR